MYILSKKLSSIFLCGSLALMLVGNSGVYAGNGALEASGAVKDKENLVSSDNKANPEALTLVKNSDVRADENGTVEEGEKLVDSNKETNPEALTLVKNSDVRADENGTVEEGEKLVDSDNETDSEDNEDDDTDDEPEGFSFDSSAVKCLGASALGAGTVVAADRVINSFRNSKEPDVKQEQRKAESVYDTQEYKSLQNELSVSLDKIKLMEDQISNISSENDTLKQDLIKKGDLLTELQATVELYKRSNSFLN